MIAGSNNPNREVRYLKTTALTRVLSNLSEDSIAALAADRSGQAEASNTNPLPYLRYSDRRIRDLDIDYNSVFHGRFDKGATLAQVTSLFGEAIIQELDLFLPDQFSEMASVRAEATPAVKDEIRKLRFVVHLIHYPCRRDGEKNAFYSQIREFMSDDERGWMEAASLDVDYFVPREVFREVAAKKGRISADYRAKIDDWVTRFGSLPDLVRDGFVMLFPDPDVRSARSYRWGPEHRWILDRVGTP